MSTIVLYYAVDVDTKRCIPDSPQKLCKEPTSKQAEEIDGAIIDFIGVCDKSPISRMSLKGFLYCVESSVVLLYKDIIMSPPLNPNTIPLKPACGQLFIPLIITITISSNMIGVLAAKYFSLITLYSCYQTVYLDS